jgi:hypothetical protein
MLQPSLLDGKYVYGMVDSTGGLACLHATHPNPRMTARRMVVICYRLILELQISRVGSLSLSQFRAGWTQRVHVM